jgi:hypothetical protein
MFIRIYGINYIHEENNGNSCRTRTSENGANLESHGWQARDIRKLIHGLKREGAWYPEI